MVVCLIMYVWQGTLPAVSQEDGWGMLPQGSPQEMPLAGVFSTQVCEHADGLHLGESLRRASVPF